MDLVELKAEIPASAVEGTDEVLLESGEAAWSVFDQTVTGRAWIIGIFPTEAEARSSWDRLMARLPVAPISGAELRTLPDADWRDSYKAHFKAWHFGRLHWVPVWERETFKLPSGDAVLWLDPGMAFGTGNHETTRLVVERLVALALGPKTQKPKPRTSNLKPKVSLIDAGCGSGILALSAAKLGFADVSGFDVDPEAVRVSLENASLNGLAGRVRFATNNLASGLTGKKADVVLANIQADILMREASILISAVAQGGTLVLSGILTAELPAVRAVFTEKAPGWQVDSRALGEWSDLVLSQPIKR